MKKLGFVAAVAAGLWPGVTASAETFHPASSAGSNAETAALERFNEPAKEAAAQPESVLVLMYREVDQGRRVAQQGQRRGEVRLAAVPEQQLDAKLKAAFGTVMGLITAHADKVDRGMAVDLRDEKGAAKDIFRAGGSIVLEFPGFDQGRYVFVDYFRHDGQVRHLLPTPDVRDNLVPARTPLTLGASGSGDKPWRVGPPFGDNLIVIIASEKPLYTGKRPVVENTEEYVAFLRSRLASAGAAFKIHYLMATTVEDEAAEAAVVEARQRLEAEQLSDEQRRLAEMQRSAEEKAKRLAEQRRRMEEKRRKAEERMRLEGDRIAAQQQRLEEERRLAEEQAGQLTELRRREDKGRRDAEEKQRRAEEQRLAAAKRRVEDERRQTEEQFQEAERRIAEERRKDEERLRAQAKLLDAQEQQRSQETQRLAKFRKLKQQELAAAKQRLEVNRGLAEQRWNDEARRLDEAERLINERWRAEEQRLAKAERQAEERWLADERQRKEKARRVAGSDGAVVTADEFDVALEAYASGDVAAALKGFATQAQAGSIRAQYMLGRMYSEGEGIAKNPAEGAKWYRLAADRGDAVAQLALAVMYISGVGVPQDIVEAYKWLEVAIAADDAASAVEAVEMQDLVEQLMTPAEIKKGRERSDTWRPKP